MYKRLHKSQNKMLMGVCGGVAEYLNLDPTILRLGMVLFTLAFGSGILAYIVMAIVMPDY